VHVEYIRELAHLTHAAITSVNVTKNRLLITSARLSMSYLFGIVLNGINPIWTAADTRGKRFYRQIYRQLKTELFTYDNHAVKQASQSSIKAILKDQVSIKKL
jgi:hypothetical protein